MSEDFLLTEKGQNKQYKYAMLFEYDGKKFAGSQLQHNARTVQQEIENALEIILKKWVRAYFSGRTDSGVNALGQVAHFTTDTRLNEYEFVYSLNGILPDDISVRALEEVDNSFHARKLARKRWYRYVIFNHPYRSALNKNCLHYYKPLDENLMNEALQKITGTQNFESFRSANSDTPSSMCMLYKATCTREGNFIYIDLIANRFVYNMVRILTGTILDVGTQKESTDHLLNVLKTHDRTKAGITVKAEALTLMSIEYPEKYNLFNQDKFQKIKEVMPENFMETQNEDIFRKAS
jgi:tRNA pseudouridine38-40 synthase